jgi:hypothetical protein
MLDELDRVNGTIQTLLGFARPSPPRRVPTPIGELIGGIAKLMRPGLAKKGIALDTTVAPELRAFPLDPDQVRQVLVNLVSNAADAIERDGTIAIRATSFPDGTGLILAVEDDGPGIPEDRRHEIFEPSTRPSSPAPASASRWPGPGRQARRRAAGGVARRQGSVFFACSRSLGVDHHGPSGAEYHGHDPDRRGRSSCVVLKQRLEGRAHGP